MVTRAGGIGFRAAYFQNAEPNQAILKAQEPARVLVAIGDQDEGIDFQQSTNALLRSGNPARLHELAASLTARDLLQCGPRWRFPPFITDKERKQAAVGVACCSRWWSMATI